MIAYILHWTYSVRNKMLMIVIWVDDHIATNSSSVLTDVKKHLDNMLKLKDLREITSFLGIQFRVIELECDTPCANQIWYKIVNPCEMDVNMIDVQNWLTSWEISESLTYNMITTWWDLCNKIVTIPSEAYHCPFNLGKTLLSET